MLPNVRRTTISGIAALSLAMTAAAPAHAWGKKEQDLVKGLAAAAIIGAVILNNRNSQPATTQRYTQPQYQPPAQTYSAPASYQQPTYQPTYQQPSYQSGIYSSPAAQAFNRLSAHERRAVQTRLSNWGYYHGGIDGSFGPQTHRAIMAYAGDTQGTNQLSTTAGAYDFYAQLIG